MSIRHDYHNHTYLCGHATGKPEEYVEHAIRLGLKEIGFSDHAPFLSHVDPTVTMSLEQLPGYYQMVKDLQEKYQEQITIKIGIEADYMPGYEEKTRALLAPYAWDYVLGSVHFIDQWGFDNPEERPAFDAHDINSVYRAYHDLLRRSAQSGIFDIMSHVDLLKKFGDKATEDLSSVIRETACVFKDTGMAIEVNASGLRKPVKEIYPALEDLRIYCEEGVPIVFGSDSHSPAQVGMDFDKAADWARQAGYREYLVFANRSIVEKILL